MSDNLERKVLISHYLANLNTLLDAQDAGGANSRSTVLATEYDRYWSELKQLITGETDASRQSGQERAFGPKTGAELPSGEPRRG